MLATALFIILRALKHESDDGLGHRDDIDVVVRGAAVDDRNRWEPIPDGYRNQGIQ